VKGALESSALADNPLSSWLLQQPAVTEFSRE